MKNCLTLVLLFISVSIFAQKTKPPIDYKWNVSISPLAMIQGDNTFMLGTEYRLKEKLALTLEGGYTFSSSYIDNSNKAGGYIVRPALRLYLNERNSFYAQFQAFYKSVVYTVHDSLRKNNGSYDSYLPLGDYKFQKNVFGMNFMIGWVIPISNDVGFIDLYVGLGTRSKNQDWKNAKDAEFPLNDFFLSDQTHMTTASLPAGIKFCFKIK